VVLFLGVGSAVIDNVPLVAASIWNVSSVGIGLIQFGIS